MFSARREERIPPRGVGMGVDMDMGMGMGGCANGGAKLPENQWAMVSGDSE